MVLTNNGLYNMDTFFYLLAVLVTAYCIIKLCIKLNNKKFWETHSNTNFPIKLKGRTIWNSRSCATAAFIFAKNALGEWCVLANKRGKGCPDFVGYWNCQSGYLEYNVNGEENASKEIFEETGIDIPSAELEFVSVETTPTANRQNVTLMYKKVFTDKLVEDFTFSREHMEKDEVEDIQFLPLSQIHKYQWAFGHYRIIRKLSENLI